jgi:hypothetical protein
MEQPSRELMVPEVSVSPKPNPSTTAQPCYRLIPNPLGIDLAALRREPPRDLPPTPLRSPLRRRSHWWRSLRSHTVVCVNSFGGGQGGRIYAFGGNIMGRDSRLV